MSVRPIALEPGGEDASFDGVGQLIADASLHGTALHLVWVHGMCTHELNWPTDRATRIATALDGTATQTGTVEETGGLTRILYQIHTRGGDFYATFVLWSPMTRHFKRTLDFDAPGSDRATSFAYQRASLNGALKTELVNDCLSDARRPHSRCDEAGGMPRAGWHTCCGSALRSDECRTG